MTNEMTDKIRAIIFYKIFTVIQSFNDYEREWFAEA